MSQDNIKKWYLDNFKQFEKVVGDDPLKSSRKTASSEFEDSGREYLKFFDGSYL